MQVKLDPLLDGLWAHAEVLRVVTCPNSYTCTTFLRKPATEELMEDEDVCGIPGEWEDLQESSV